MRRIALAALLATSFLATGANATILTFDLANPGVVTMDQTYGDNVAGSPQGGHSYGVGAEGYTPNVVTEYAGTGNSQMTRWTTDYGDLVNVLENESDGDSLLRITFTADPGYAVTLYGFDLGGWYRTDYVIPTLSVVSGTTLFTQSNVAVAGVNGHSTFNFGAGGLVGGQSLSILVDLTGLGGSSDNIGIDNVRFGQGLAPSTGPIPEPATWAMMIVGFGAAGSMIRSRKALVA